MDAEALSIKTLLEASELSYELAQQSAQRSKPIKPPSFTNWDEDQRLLTYIQRDTEDRKLRPPLFLRRSADPRKRQGLLTTRNWREDFPEIERLIQTRGRAVTHPLAKAAVVQTPVIVLANPSFPQWRAVPGKEVLRDIVFPTAKAKVSTPLRSFRSIKVLKVTENWRKQADISFSRLDLKSCRDLRSESESASPRKRVRFASALRWSPSRALRRRDQQ